MSGAQRCDTGRTPKFFSVIDIGLIFFFSSLTFETAAGINHERFARSCTCFSEATRPGTARSGVVRCIH